MMRLRKIIALTVCAGLIAYFGLACCCPVAFPVGDWSEMSDTKGAGAIAVPRLEITYPAEGVTTDSSQIEVSGTTDSDASVTVNGTPMEVYSDGSFRGVVELVTGENVLSFTATRPGGDPAVQEVTVISNYST